MNIKRIIDKNGKLIWYGFLIIVCIFFAIKSLNSYYEKDEERKKNEASKNQTVQTTQNTTETEKPKNNSTESKSIKQTMSSFVNYCNNREIENAYKILTDECKNAMFPTAADFERIYIKNIYNVTRTYELVPWSTDDNKTTYLVKLYGDILATGGIENYTEDYYTFVETENGTYKLNINNYIYGEDRNIEKTVNNIKINIGHVDVYEEYERAKITITNNTNRTICLTGNKYENNIYLQSAKETKYSSLNSKFDTDQIIMTPNGTQTLWVEFNKVYSATNKAQYLVLSDVILDYENYLNSEDKENYSYRTSLKVEYQK